MEKKATYRKSTVILLAIFCCILWGSITPVVKASYVHFGISQDRMQDLMVFAGVRYILCGLAGIAFGTVKNRKLLLPRPASWGMVAKLALVQTFIQQLFFYISLTHISGINASILGSLNNFFSILIASLIYHQERLTIRKMAGCLLGFSGVVYINITQSAFSSNLSLAGEGALLVSCITCGASYAMIKEYSAREDVLVLNAYQFFLGGIGLYLAGILMGGRMYASTPAGYLLFSYMCLMPITAFTIWGRLLKSSSVSQLSAFGFVNPIAGVILSAVFLDESSKVSLFQCAISLLLVSLGIYIVNSRDSQQSN